MLLIPAIDLLDGRAVRLAEGVRERATVYDLDPRRLAVSFAAAGARRIHVVDLDGAFAGAPRQRVLLAEIIDAIRAHGAEIEVGGGLRTRGAVEDLLALGVDKVVVGTLAIREPDTVHELCERHPGAIVVAVDARDGVVAVDGWRELSSLTADALARAAESWGAAALLYTDVARDGLQGGANVAATVALQQQVAIPVIASGGIGSLADLDSLRAAGIRAAICGRALYEGKFTLEEALERC